MRRFLRPLGVVGAFLFALAIAASASAVGVPVKNTGISPDKFQPSQSCGCHAALIEEWSQSMHAKALTDELFIAKVSEANAATDGKLGAFCKRCHAPAAEMTGELAKGGALSPGPAEGISCSFCHQISGMLKGEPGNVSQLVDPSGTRRAQIEDPQAPHPAAYSELHRKADICGGCHNVNHPVNGMHLESTFSEWSKGPYAKEGIVCQDCHMSRQPGVIGPMTGRAAGGAPQRDNIYTMTFVGAQVAQGPSVVATARLKSAATLVLEIPEIVPSGSSAQATVTITNSGAGHYLPTGLTEVRQMWLEVTATDAGGKSTKLGERVFGTILQDDKGNAPVELWDATKIKSDDRIPPKESVTNQYAFTMPAGMEKATVKAALFYKSVPDELAKKAGVENPTTEMAMDSKTVFASVAARTKDAMGGAESPTLDAVQWSGMTTWVILGVLVVLAAVIANFWRRSRRSS